MLLLILLRCNKIGKIAFVLVICGISWNLTLIVRSWRLVANNLLNFRTKAFLACFIWQDICQFFLAILVNKVNWMLHTVFGIGNPNRHPRRDAYHAFFLRHQPVASILLSSHHILIIIIQRVIMRTFLFDLWSSVLLCWVCWPVGVGIWIVLWCYMVDSELIGGGYRRVWAVGRWSLVRRPQLVSGACAMVVEANLRTALSGLRRHWMTSNCILIILLRNRRELRFLSQSSSSKLGLNGFELIAI